MTKSASMRVCTVFDSLKFLTYVLVLMILAPSLGQAQNASTEEQLYGESLKVVLSLSKPTRFAVWNKAIGASVLFTVRVPRHAPEQQFVHGLRGLPSSMQAALFDAATLVDRGDDVLKEFKIPRANSKSLGFVTTDALQQLVAGAKPHDYTDWVLAVGFSKIGFSKDGRNALFYAEQCAAQEDGICDAEAFWYERRGSTWRLRGHTFLWEGITQSFWELQDIRRREPQNAPEDKK